VVILLMVIGGYFIGGYFILLVVSGDYFIGGYWRLFY